MKYVRAFFNILGFLTFIGMVGAATFWYIGYQKNKVSSSTVTFKDVTMTPVKETTTITTADPETLPDIQRISRPAARDHLVDPTPISNPTKKAAKPAKKPVAKPAPVVKPVPVTYTTTATKVPAKRTPTRKPSRKPERQQAAAPTPAPQSDLSPCTLTFKATDRSGNQRTGHGVVNVSETTELEKMAARRVQAIQELELAGQQLRNPYGGN